MRTIGACILLLAIFAAPPISAQTENVCKGEERVDRDIYLRRLSLDLLGRPPAADEYEKMSSERDVSEETIRTMLGSTDFVRSMQRFHYDILWPYLPFGFVGYAEILEPDDYYAQDPVLWRPLRAVYLADVMLPPSVNSAYLCVDEPAPEPAFDIATGDPIPLRINEIDGFQQPVYGWLRRATYFSAGAELKICSIEAREDYYSREGAPCEVNYGGYYSTCGCGPDLRWCGTYETELYTLPAAFRAELDWAVRRVVEEPRSYLDLLTSKETLLTGPAAYYFRWQRNLSDISNMANPPVEDRVLESIDYQDTVGKVVTRREHNAGILTSSFFLLRHQTARARVNRFDNAFLCQPYSPPPDGIGDLSNVAPNPNLSEREKCSYCHQRLEPRTVYFGRFAEVGGVELFPQYYPEWRQDCYNCASQSFDAHDPGMCDYDCARNYYVSIDGPREVLEPQWGRKKELAFRSDAELDNYDRGPRGLVDDAEETGAIARCLTNRLATKLLHRAPVEDEAEWISELSDKFRQNGYRLPELVFDIVTSPNYRRAP